jgi:hypothetical protein
MPCGPLFPPALRVLSFRGMCDSRITENPHKKQMTLCFGFSEILRVEGRWGWGVYSFLFFTSSFLSC